MDGSSSTQRIAATDGLEDEKTRGREDERTRRRDFSWRGEWPIPPPLMATLVTGSARGGCDGSARNLAGRLDPLTLAMYRWRVASDAYDSREVRAALASRLAGVMTSDSPDGVEWRGPAG
jgi:hypothetical protein